MLETDSIQVDGEPHEFYSEMRDTQDLVMAMQFWTARFARDLLQFGVFLRRLLFEVGAIGQADNEFLAAVFQVVRRGKEEMAVDAAWSATARRLVQTAATHLLIRYSAWRERTEAFGACGPAPVRQI